MIILRKCFGESQWQIIMKFSLLGVLEGLKSAKPGQDDYYVEFGSECLTAVVHAFESRIWAEKEIADNGITFPIKAGQSDSI